MQALGQIIQLGAMTTHTAQSCQTNNSTSIRPKDDDSSVGKLLNLFADADLSRPFAHCEVCHTPTQKDIEILGVKRRVPIACRCRSEAYEREKKEAEQKELMRRLERFKAYSLMDNRFEMSTFENWSHRPDNRDDYILGTKYCENWDTMYANNRGLLLYGKAGNGKTFLSFAIANALYRQGKAVMAISISKLLSIIKDNFDKHGEYGETDVLNTVRDASLLVLDDLGVEYKTAWAYEKLYAIIDTRYRASKPTIITTNFMLDTLRENLATVDMRTRTTDPSERVFSRITEICAFHEVKGASWRISKGAQNKTDLLKELGLSST
jgi:DNA replication protein DnaC